MRHLEEGCCLYLYMDGKRVVSIARTWDEIAAELAAGERRETVDDAVERAKPCSA